MFPVDEAFVKENLVGLTDEDRAMMDAFVGQSLEKRNVENEKQVIVRKGLFRISDFLPSAGDNSPLRDAMFRPKNLNQRGEFDFEGKLIATDGARSTKLTKIFKRRDNEGKLLLALRRMKLD
jgi:hypothetical protein